jgi:hypothetical protein
LAVRTAGGVTRDVLDECHGIHERHIAASPATSPHRAATTAWQGAVRERTTQTTRRSNLFLQRERFAVDLLYGDREATATAR